MTEEEKKARLRPGDIVRITSNEQTAAKPGVRYFGALAVVHELTSWGVLAAIPVPWAGDDAIIPVRLAWEDFAITGGKIPWVMELTAPDDPRGRA